MNGGLLAHYTRETPSEQETSVLRSDST